jgi:hypothetical protein
VLAKYLEHHYAKDHWSGKRVLEVGAGCGLVGLALALQGADVVLTDRKEVVPTLQENVQRNVAGSKVAPLTPLAPPILTHPGFQTLGATRVPSISVRELDWREDATGVVGTSSVQASEFISYWTLCARRIRG